MMFVRWPGLGACVTADQHHILLVSQGVGRILQHHTQQVVLLVVAKMYGHGLPEWDSQQHSV